MNKNKRGNRRGPGSSTKGCKWVIISGDASHRNGEILGYYDSKEIADQHRPTFGHVRRETSAERDKRKLNTSA